MKISASSGEFGGYGKGPADWIRQFKNTKFKYINCELGGEPFSSDDDTLWRKFADELGEAAADAGITYVIAHAPCVNALGGDEAKFEKAVRAVRRAIETCHILGIPDIVVHASSGSKLTAKEFAEGNKRFYSSFFDLMEKYDIHALAENMDGPVFYPLSTGREMREFVEYIDHPLMGICWDIAHANLNPKTKKISQYESILEMGDLLRGLHVADNFGNGPHHHTFPFAGIVNWDEIMQGLVDIGYKGYFNYECSGTLRRASNNPFKREPWVHNGETVTKLLNPSLKLKTMSENLMYDIAEYMLTTYGVYEE